MATENEIVYEIKAKVDDIEKKLSGIEDQAKKAGSGTGGIGGLSGKFTAIGTAAIAAAGAITTYFVGKALKDGIAGAIEQEQAINSMNTALALAGRFSIQASQDMQDFASNLQNISIIGDDTTLQMLALATAYTKNNQEAQKLVKAAADLSSALGINFETAVRQLGGSLSGVTGQLGRIIPQVRTFTEDQLKAGAAVDLVAKRFTGAASSAAETFGGKLIQIKNSFGDLLEEIGMFVTKSPALTKVLNLIKEAFDSITGVISRFRKNTGDIFAPIILGMIDVAQTIVTVIGPVFDYAFNLINRFIDNWKLFLQGIQQFRSGQFGDLGSTIKEFFSSNLTFTSLEELFKMNGSTAANAYLEGLKETFMTIKDPMADTKRLMEMSMGAVKETVKDGVEVVIPLAQMLAAGISNSIQQMGTALVKGGLSFGSFAKIALGFIGDFAIQLGTMIITAALAIDALKTAILTFGGVGFALAAGAALILVGSMLKAFAGGPAAVSAGAGQAAQTGITSGVGDTLTQLQDTDERQRQTNVTVNIEGNVLGDKRTLGREIADALNEAFGTEGIVIARGGLA